MKKLFGALLALFCSAAFATSTVPVQLLNPTGSTSGQAILSTGSSTAPAWGNLSAAALTGIVPVANGGTGDSSLTANGVLIGNGTGAITAAAACSNGQMLLGVTGGAPVCGNNPTITGGSVNGAPIGASTPSTGAFTTLSASSTVSGIPGRLLNIQVFTSSGTYTPTSGTTKDIIRAVGGGGGGGGTAATSTAQSAIGQAGSSGAYAEAYWTSVSSQTVTIGAAGTASAGVAGGNGGSTSVGSVVVCPGGLGGTLGAAASNTTGFTVGAAGLATAPTVTGATTIVGARGNIGTYAIVLNSSYALNGVGGPSPFGGSGPSSGNANGAGGSGGSAGASSAATSGQTGTTGLVVIYEYQ
jgi:hypothetical protein